MGHLCPYGHAVKQLVSLNASASAISAISIWHMKIVTGSHDGFWRLWKPQDATCQLEFEHNVGGGKIACIIVASNFLFCGFEAVSSSLPGNAQVGMIHAWNLANLSLPPLEFHIHPQIPYAHASCVSHLAIYQQDVILSGDQYGVIRIWKYTKPGVFSLQTTIHGHASEITGIVVVNQSMVWSSSTDCSIRMWDYLTGESKFLLTPLTVTNGIHSGHVNAVTGLVSCEMPGLGTFVFSSSMDGTVKVWNGANGDCIASKNHISGVVSMMASQDPFFNPILVLGLENGNIVLCNFMTLSTIMILMKKYSIGHKGPVNAVATGTPGTFYTGGEDGKLLVCKIEKKLI